MAFLDSPTSQDPLDFFLEFTHLLRLAGLRVGLTETEDAMQAVRVVTEFKSWRTALKATLIKKKEDEAIFDRIFDLYFGPWGGTHDFMGRGSGNLGQGPAAVSSESEFGADQQELATPSRADDRTESDLAPAGSCIVLVDAPPHPTNKSDKAAMQLFFNLSMIISSIEHASRAS